MRYRQCAFLAVTILGSSISQGLLGSSSAQAAGFIEDATLNGGIYYWQRERDRKDLAPDSKDYGKYTTNLSHATFNANLDFSSGYWLDVIGTDLAFFGAWEVADSSKAAPNEIAFSKGKSTWHEDWSGDKSGLDLYKAALKLKMGSLWARAGYLQPSGQTLLAPHWSFMPGTYRGAEAGMVVDFSSSGELAFSYMWADRYKAPWNQHMDDFRRTDRKTDVDYLHSIGMKYDFKNNLVLEAAVGEAQGYMNQFFAKVSYALPIAENDLRTSYQFYGAKDRIGNKSDPSDVYDGLAWLQAITLGYTMGPFDLRLEGTQVKANGNQGYFLQRMTPSYASSNGRLDIWWDARSDFNANGEKALFAGITYDLKGWNLPGWAVGTSYVYAWDAKPSTNPIYDQHQRLRESAVNFDIIYTIQHGAAKGTQFKLHHTRYDNHTSIPSWGGGYGNIFQDEKDVKFIVIAPFTIF